MTPALPTKPNRIDTGKSPVETSIGVAATFEPKGVRAPSVFVTVHTSASPNATATSIELPGPLTSGCPFLVQLYEVA